MNMVKEENDLFVALCEIFGKGRVSKDQVDRLSYSRDLWPKLTLGLRRGELPFAPSFIVWPETTDDVSRLLELANKASIPIIPFGGGSGVCGGAVPVTGGVVLDMKRMNSILSVDPISMTVTAQPGIIGQHLESALNLKGFTMGHFPSSITCSSLGGYIAARSAGQCSSRYGKIEDMVVCLEAVLPNGRIVRTKKTPRSATGPDFNQLICGSEGTLGVITEATMAIHPLPEVRMLRGILWNSVEKGLEAIRSFMQKGIRPAVVRLYDEQDTALTFGKEEEKPSGCMLILCLEGPKNMVEAEWLLFLSICQELGGIDLGEEPGNHWWKHRYSIAYRMSEILYQRGTFLDTIEVATTWEHLEDLYMKMKEEISEICFVMGHFSHFYPQGGAIYFTFVGQGGDREEDLYQDVWNRAMETCLMQGGTISHHHGIGILKGPWLKRELGELMEVFLTLKKALDPNNILNPGKMGL